MRSLVVVTGPPASGKSELARRLAERLDLPLLAKDVVKEALFDALGAGDLAWSKQLSDAAYEVMFALAPSLPAAVLEANFRPGHGPRLLELCENPVEVHCTCPPEERARRWESRDRHPGHLDDLGMPEDDFTGPLALGPNVLEVDTADPVDVDTVAAWVAKA